MRRPSLLTSAQAGEICQRYWQAFTSDQTKQAINALYREYEATYGLSRSRLRKLVADDQRRNPAKYVVPQTARNVPPNTPDEAERENRQKPGTAGATPAMSARSFAGKPSDGEKAVIGRPRARTDGLPPTAIPPARQQDRDVA